MSEGALSVSQVVARAKAALEEIKVSVVGEVSELTDRPGYKAVYFTLTDGEAVLPCLMWRSEFERAGVSLSVGAMVEAYGSLTVYPAKGRMQFQVRRLALAGEGVLRMQVAALAKKLQAEGLMAPGRKRALPELPERIGLVTSPRGKAVHDVLRTLSRRYPMGEVVFAGVQVEGGEAPERIVEGIRAVDEAGVDVVIVCRGGGSYEDLMPFNDERVARAIVACSAPVVTGIGHEPDITIADMVADVSASTPTAAAEKVAPTSEELRRRLQTAAVGLARGLQHAALSSSERLGRIESRVVFHDPASVLAPFGQRVDEAAEALSRVLPARLERDILRFESVSERVDKAVRLFLERGETRVARLEDRIRALSPLGVLARGYAICFDARGRAVRDASVLSVGDDLDVRFWRGSAACTVDTVEVEDE
ncbi:MAG: exodeoxyribonuclease VII large subunit [Coriobacteriia bacterium]